MPTSTIGTESSRRRRNCVGFVSLAIFACSLAIVQSRSAIADGPPKPAPAPVATRPDFNKSIAPLFVKHCLACHSGTEASGGLDLTRAEALAKGGDSGAVVVAGKPDESYLIGRLRDGEMPPEGKGVPLSKDETATMTAWVAAGARWPADRVLSSYELTTDKRAGFDWWSLKPPVRPDVPLVKHASWVRNPIDAFIAQALEERGLEPSPEADRATLMRRAKFDLLGLPPTPEEVREFVADSRPDAYERLIDRLLASPHYGERWGRHWLDVVRFGESGGYEVNVPRPNAWPYRDWVIRALNDDMPYPRFVLEQLAGDQVGADAATGFIVGGAHDEVGNATVEGQLQQRTNDLDDMLSTTTTAFLGLTAGCARCHDHKFDPITQRDYYALSAVFAGVRHGEREVKPADYEERRKQEPEIRRQLAALDRELAAFEPLAVVTLSTGPSGSGPAGSGPAGSGQSVGNTAPLSAKDAKPTRPPVHPLGNVDRFAPTLARYVRFTILATNSVEPCLDELEIFTAEPSPRNVALASEGAKASASGVYADGKNANHKLEHINDGRYGNGRSWISSEIGGGWIEIQLPETVEIDRVAWARDRQGSFADRLATRYKIDVAIEPGRWRTVATGDDRRPYKDGAPPEAISPGDVPPEKADALRALLARRKELESRLPLAGAMKVYAGTFVKPDATHRLHRGDPMQKLEEIAPGAIAAVGPPLQLAADAAEKDRRVALARWIGDERNPLTARVMVNRVWHYHFGQGLVSTPSNFGFHGGQPSHPRLLDWLATEFVAQGWRVKGIHRLMMLSATYRQASSGNARAATVDAGGRLFWRYAPRRLEAEPIRDAILAVSGKLDLRMGGPGYDAFEPNTNYVHVYLPREKFGPAEWRRMVYQSKPRVLQDATFGAFDCPDASQVTPKRNVSTTAIQALSLLNSPFVVEQAEFFAARLRSEAGDAPADQARRGFWLALGRGPGDEELARASRLIGEHGLSAFCRALYNANEFVYLR
jgi:Protein of unknown function (DUF1553)/Protein of unknown function (DUF1549)/Planctomycete cytochrome C